MNRIYIYMVIVNMKNIMFCFYKSYRDGIMIKNKYLIITRFKNYGAYILCSKD